MPTWAWITIGLANVLALWLAPLAIVAWWERRRGRSGESGPDL